MKYDRERKEIFLERELNNLDKFVVKFIEILRKHTDYVVISGYVSILLGRTRTTEDIDFFIKRMSKEKFIELVKDLEENGFWCINTASHEEMFSYLNEKSAIRFAIKGSSIPNVEFKFPKRKDEEETFDEAVIVHLKNTDIKISSLERQIAFKKYYLGSDKDKEDALHVEELFKKDLDFEKINKFKELIKNIKRNGQNREK